MIQDLKQLQESVDKECDYTIESIENIRTNFLMGLLTKHEYLAQTSVAIDMLLSGDKFDLSPKMCDLGKKNLIGIALTLSK